MYMNVVFLENKAFFKIDHGWIVVPAFGCGYQAGEMSRISIPPDARVDGVRIISSSHTFSARLWNRSVPTAPPVSLPENRSWCTFSTAAAAAIAELAAGAAETRGGAVHINLCGVVHDGRRVAKIAVVPVSTGGFPVAELAENVGNDGPPFVYSQISPHLSVRAAALASALRESLTCGSDVVTLITARVLEPCAVYVVAGTPESPRYIAEVPYYWDVPPGCSVD